MCYTVPHRVSSTTHLSRWEHNLSVEHTIHLMDVSRISAHLTNVPLLVLSFCCKNKARICANNRNGWLSEGKLCGSISWRHSVICFHFPLVSLWSSLLSVTAPVSIVSERWLKAGFEHERFYFGVLLFCPHDHPWEPSSKCIAQLHCPGVFWKKSWQTDP